MSDTETQVQLVQLKEIGQIALTVTDLERAKAFYKDALGMSLLFDAGTMVFFQIGTVRLMIGLPDPDAVDAPKSGGSTILYFKVDDIKSTHQSLQKAGVNFTHEPHLVAKMPDHELWMAFLKDPDENLLALMSEVR